MMSCPCCNRPQTLKEYCIQIKDNDYDTCLRSGDDVEENRTLAYEGEDMDRSDAQGCVEAEDMRNGPYACVFCRDKVRTLNEGLCTKCFTELSAAA